MSKPLLYLDLLNLTVGSDGTTATGYKPSEIYLVIQGLIGSGDGPYAHFDWTTGQLKKMAIADNTVKVPVLGGDPTIKYAKYWITLEELLTKSYYDQTNGLQIPIPIYSGRLYISFSTPVYLNVVTNNKGVISPAEPDEGNPVDPNFHTIFDKFEFTSNTDNVLFSNTTAVDFVGIPMAYSINGSDTPQEGFAIDATAQKDPFAYLTKKFVADSEFSVLVEKTRLLAPKVNSANFPPFGNDGTYMDAYVKYCWNHYFTSKDTITIWNYVDITTAENSSLSNDKDGKGCKWTAEGKITDSATGTLTFTITSLVDKNNKALTPPTNTFIITLPSTWDVLRQGGIFAPLTSLSGYLFSIDGDIKNQVSTAINRNVMHAPYKGDYDETNTSKGTIYWADRCAYYEDNGVPAASLSINKYGKFLHELSIKKLCYALAYDDKYSQNVNLSGPLSTSTPTVMKLSIYYKKPKSNTGVFPTGSIAIKDLIKNDYTIDVKQDPSADGVIISVSPKNGATLTNCDLMYSSKDKDNESFNLYVPGVTTNNQIHIPASNLSSPFRFVFRFEIKGDSVQGRQFLLPQDAAIANGHVLLYDPTKTTTPLTLTGITNPPTT